MKKNKLFGIILSVMMIISCFATIAAEESTDSYTITITNPNKGHVYEAYQIFSGRLENDESADILSDIQWGDNVKGSELLEELKQDSRFEKCTNAAQIADILSKESNNSQFIEEFAKIAAKHLKNDNVKKSTYEGNEYVISGLQPGYYLVKDEDESISGNDAYTDFILKITDHKKVTPKSSVPTVEKKVLENSNKEWQDIADYSIGEDVSFRLIGSLPDSISSYKDYTYIFHDKLSKGLTFKEGSVKAYVANQDNDKVEDINSDLFHINQSPSDEGCSFEVIFDNIKNIKKSGGSPLDKKDKIIVEYKAVLNADAVIAGEGNPNTVSLEFSNNPNGTGTGRTPDDTVKVFTYELVVNKKDEDQKLLIGADFTLQKFVDNAWVDVKSYKGLNISKFTFTGLDCGKYRLEETKAPKGYNKIKDIIFTIESDYDLQELKLDNLIIKDEEGTVISGEDNLFNVNIVPEESAPNIVTDVINKKGAILPETGGIGTTIFYIAGSMIMIGAAVVFVSKKRKKTN